MQEDSGYGSFNYRVDLSANRLARGGILSVGGWVGVC